MKASQECQDACTANIFDKTLQYEAEDRRCSTTVRVGELSPDTATGSCNLNEGHTWCCCTKREYGPSADFCGTELTRDVSYPACAYSSQATMTAYITLKLERLQGRGSLEGLGLRELGRLGRLGSLRHRKGLSSLVELGFPGSLGDNRRCLATW
jgi:hypothetical protein